MLGRSAVLHQDGEAVEMPELPDSVLSQARLHIRGLADLALEVAPGPLASGQLQERHQLV